MRDSSPPPQLSIALLRQIACPWLIQPAVARAGPDQTPTSPIFSRCAITLKAATFDLPEADHHRCRASRPTDGLLQFVTRAASQMASRPEDGRDRLPESNSSSRLRRSDNRDEDPASAIRHHMHTEQSIQPRSGPLRQLFAGTAEPGRAGRVQCRGGEHRVQYRCAGHGRRYVSPPGKEAKRPVRPPREEHPYPPADPCGLHPASGASDSSLTATARPQLSSHQGCRLMLLAAELGMGMQMTPQLDQLRQCLLQAVQ